MQDVCRIALRAFEPIPVGSYEKTRALPIRAIGGFPPLGRLSRVCTLGFCNGLGCAAALHRLRALAMP